MFKKVGLFLLFSVFLPVSAHALVLKVEFTGHVVRVEGSGLGYSLGDQVSGSSTAYMTPEILEGDKWSESDRAFFGGYYFDGYGGPFVESDFLGYQSAEGVDYVAVFSEDYDGPEWEFGLDPEDYEELLIVGDIVLGSTPLDGGLTESFSSGSFLGITLPGMDFLHDDRLSGVEAYADDPAALGKSIGTYYESHSIFDPHTGEVQSEKSDWVYFDFDSIRITTVQDVSEPNPILFLALASGLLIWNRRKAH